MGPTPGCGTSFGQRGWAGALLARSSDAALAFAGALQGGPFGSSSLRRDRDCVHLGQSATRLQRRVSLFSRKRLSERLLRVSD